MNFSPPSKANWSSAKQAMLDRLLQAERLNATSGFTSIERRADGEGAPLSFGQQRLWFLDQLVPGNAFYNVPFAIRSPWPINVPVLERVLQEIVQRHETLRTVFAVRAGQPMQIVGAGEPFKLEMVDLSGEGAGRESAARQLADEEARRPFDLSIGPLFRCRLLRLAAADHLLLLTMHHIISDGWSLNVLEREIAALYGAFVLGRPPPLPPLPIQYGDYAAWQRAHLTGEVLERHLDYWRERLADAPMLRLPLDRPRPAIQSYRGSGLALDLPAALVQKLRQLGAAEGCTLFMTLLAGFQALLARYAGQDDIVVGVPVAGRDRAEVEGLIGFFINTLVMRTDLSGAPSFRQLLGRVRRTATDAFGHQELPFEKLVEELQPARDLSRNPLFQVTIQLFAANAPPTVAGAARERVMAGSRAAAPEAVPIIGDRGTSAFDLGLNVWELPGGGLGGFVEYSTDLFDAPTVRRLTDHWRHLLQRAADSADAPLDTLSILHEAERRNVLVEWNHAPSDYPRDADVHELFLEQAQRRPDALAVTCGDRCLTYGEVRERASRLARQLAQLGAKPGALVGVCLPRSERLAWTLVGVLETGAAYLPLDPNYPVDRLAFMIGDARPCVILTQADQLALFDTVRSRAEALSPDTRVEVRDVDALVEGSTTKRRPSRAAPRQRSAALDVAYVIYTSGSTGIPKGTCIPHRAIVRLVRNTNYIDIRQDDIIAQTSSSSFDAATFEIWGALLNGAQIAIVGSEALLSAPDLADWLERHRVTTMFLTTALFNQLSRQEPGIFGSLSTLLFGGEACDPDRVRAVMSARPPGRLLHVYGPTENTTFSLAWLVDEVPEGAVSVPIGRPVANSTAYVFDRNGEPVPIGVSGELYLGGDGLALCYLNDPNLTAQKFVAGPGGGRLYRTGDLVHWSSDGQLVFEGRADTQVKVRGFRVELAEIEIALNSSPDVDGAVVVLREDAPNDRRLVAYVVPASVRKDAVSHLRAFIQERLPAYMIPAAFVLMDTLPLNANGKVDRRALPPPDSMRPQLRAGYAPPGTANEVTLAEIWSQALQLQRIGIHDNFFELGGDSILSIQIISRARAAGLQLTPQQLFQHQTIAELAAAAGAHRVAISGTKEGPGPVPLTPVQRWFFDKVPADPHHFNQAVLLDLPVATGAAVLRRALEALVAHHPALRLRFHLEQDSRGAGWMQTTAADPGGDLLREIDLSGCREDQQALRLEEQASEVQASLNLEDGPLIRAALFSLGEGRGARLLIAAHHLLVDGVSWRILLDDLQTACDQLGRGQSLELPARTTTFQHWAERLKARAQSKAVLDELPFWLDTGRASSFRLPLDMPDAADDPQANCVAAAQDVTVELDDEETTALLQGVAAAQGTQVNDVMLSAMLRALSGWTGQRNVLLDLEGHGREAVFADVDLSRTVGWFTTVFPIVLEDRGSDSAADLLHDVRAQLGAIPNRGLGYGLLRYLSDRPDIVRALASLPTPPVSFNYLGRFGSRTADEPAQGQNRGGASTSPRGSRFHLLEVNGSVIGKRLRFAWTFSQRLHRRETIARVADDFVQTLRSIAAECRSGSRPVVAADYSKARMSFGDLNKLINRMSKRER